MKGLPPIGVLLVGALLTACGQSVTAPPNVVLLVLDTTRADRCSAYGYVRETTDCSGARPADLARLEALLPVVPPPAGMAGPDR